MSAVTNPAVSIVGLFAFKLVRDIYGCFSRLSERSR
jgi:uncharacterized membrane protein YuzA (DUF378 family)